MTPEACTSPAHGNRWLAKAILLLITATTPLAAQDTAYVPAAKLESGHQIVAIYFGAHWCHPCQTPEMKRAIRQMKPLVAAQAMRAGAEFSAMVVVLDFDLKDGLDFVTPLGPFDEYSFGSDLESVAAQRFIWGDSLTFKGVPQVIVYERDIRIAPNTPIVFGPDHVLRRVSGDSIPIWVKAGALIR